MKCLGKTMLNRLREFGLLLGNLGRIQGSGGGLLCIGTVRNGDNSMIGCLNKSYLGDEKDRVRLGL